MDVTDAATGPGRVPLERRAERPSRWLSRTWPACLRGPRLTVRTRLALLCRALVVLAGALVLGGTYFLLTPRASPITMALRAGSQPNARGTETLYAASTHPPMLAGAMPSCLSAVRKSL